MWNDVDQTTAALFLQCDQVNTNNVVKNPKNKYLNFIFEPQFKKKKQNRLYELLKPEKKVQKRRLCYTFAAPTNCNSFSKQM